jgi:tRNA A-37 threonylcarbamoyl transferase component Bud32
MKQLPEGYEQHSTSKLHYIVREGRDQAIRTMGLTSLSNLEHLLAEGRPQGRGRVADLFPKLKLNHEPLVVKQVLHGGLFGRFNPEGHRGPDRLLRELAITEEARNRGVPVPELAYLAWTVARPCRLFLATVRVTASRNLAELLHDEPPGTSRRQSLTAAAIALRKMHDAGMVHADLNLSNVMVTELAGWPEGFVLDLDRSTFPSTLDDSHRAANLTRLLRSLEKAEDLAALVGPHERARFLRDYCDGTGPSYHTLQELVRRRARWFTLHRLAWKLGWS